MSKITVLNEKAIAVEGIPKGSGGFIIVKNTFRWKPNPLKFWWDQVKLPPGQWSIEGRASEINSGILEKIFPHPKLSGISAMCECLKSKGLNPSEVIILIKQ